MRMTEFSGWVECLCPKPGTLRVSQLGKMVCPPVDAGKIREHCPFIGHSQEVCPLVRFVRERAGRGTHGSEGLSDDRERKRSVP